MGARGIGIAIAFSAVAQVLFIYLIWNRQARNTDSAGVYGFYLKMALTALPLFLLLETFRHFVLAGLDPETMSGNLLTLGLVGTLGAALMLVTARLAGVEEMNALVRVLRRRFNRG